MLSVIARVFPVIILIALGYGFRRTGFVDAGTVGGFKKLVVNFSLPALLFNAFSDTGFELRYFAIFVAVFAVCGVMLLFGTGLRRALRIENPYFPAIFSGFETGMMGYSLFVAVFGPEDMYKLALVDLGQVTFVFFVLVSYLGRVGGKSGSIKSLALSFVTSPVILAICAGIAVGASGILGQLRTFAPTGTILDTLKLVSNLTVPLICIVIGYELHLDLRTLGLPLVAILLRLFILMILAFGLDRILIRGLLHLDRGFSVALYTMFLLPPPFVIPIFMPSGAPGSSTPGELDGQREFMVASLSLGVLVSLAAFIILILAV